MSEKVTVEEDAKVGVSSASGVRLAPLASKQAGRLFSMLMRPVEGWRLRWFECSMVVALLIDAGWRFLHWREALTHWGFHPAPEEMWQMGYMKTFPLPPQWAIPVIGVFILLAAAAVLFNKWRRAGLFGMLATAVWIYGVDPWTTQALNRIFIGVFLLLATAPGYTTNERGEKVVTWAVIGVFQAMLVIIYFAAGWTKAFQGEWLKSDLCLWNIVQGYHRTDEAAFLLRHLPVWMWTVMQHSTLVFELGAPLWFCLRWTRPFAVLFGISLHISIAFLMERLFFFGAVMLSFYWLFLSREWLAVLCQRIMGATVWAMRRHQDPVVTRKSLLRPAQGPGQLHSQTEWQGGDGA